MKPIVFLLGFLTCFGLIFVLVIAQLVRFGSMVKKGGLEAAPKFCPHCGAETPVGGSLWFPTSPGAALRASGVRFGPVRLGGPLSKMGWTCVKCGGTAMKGPST